MISLLLDVASVHVAVVYLSATRTCVTNFLRVKLDPVCDPLSIRPTHCMCSKRSGRHGTWRRKKKKKEEAMRKQTLEEEEEEVEAWWWWWEGGWCWWSWLHQPPPPESKSIAGTPQLTILPTRHTAGAPSHQPTQIHKSTQIPNTQTHKKKNQIARKLKIHKCTQIPKYTNIDLHKIQKPI